jgi:hypothetical protein
MAATDSDIVRGAIRSDSNGPQIFSLELEDYNNDEEIDSLIQETVDVGTFDGNHRLTDLRKRNIKQSDNDGSRIGAGAGSMLGFVRSHLRDALFSWGHVRVLAILAVFSVLFVFLRTEQLAEMDPSKDIIKEPHAPSLGFDKNEGHYDQVQCNPKLDQCVSDDEDDDEFIAALQASDGALRDDSDDNLKREDGSLVPISNVGRPVRTRTVSNKKNRQGHYRHDPLRSVYSSPLFGVDATIAAQEQQLFEDAMKKVVEQYGQWTTPPLKRNVRLPLGTQYKDYPSELLIESRVWQTDSVYLALFFDQAKRLVTSVKEGIYATYGFGINATTTNLDRRLSEFRVIRGDVINTDQGAAFDANTRKRASGIAYLNTAAWNALIRKLLHGMMSMDYWYVVAVGNANLYAGNNFQQSAIMEFNDIMEPVFDKLGMKLIVRNMGMNASTTVTALGGVDIVGEADVFWHIPDTREGVATESVGMVDLLHKQAILSGERVPIILSPSPAAEILAATNHSAWFGNIQPGASFCETTQSIDGQVHVPAVKACRFVQCDAKVDCNKHSSVCWIPRNDYTPTHSQNKDVGYQKAGFPNFRQQKLEGSKLAMLILHGLDEALDQWMLQTKNDAVPLPDEMWHVGRVYTDIREKVRTMGWGDCDHLMRRVHPSICHMQMHALTEWTPQVDPKKRLRSIANSGIVDESDGLSEAYDTIDLWPKEWRIEDTEVDVHMIAIAATKVGNDNMGVQTSSGSETNDDDNGFESPADDTHDRRRRIKRRRRMISSTVSKGRAWALVNAPIGFCDGSANSHCNRIASNTCFLSRYNHFRGGLIAHGQSGKLSLSIPNVQEGIVLARFDWELEDGPRIKNLPHDFNFTMTVNGATTSMGRADFARRTLDVTKDLRVHILYLDERINNRTMTVSKPSQIIDIELEVSSAESGLKPLVLLSHIYYA